MEHVQLADNVLLFCADCAEIIPELEKFGIDSCVTDPPYGLSSSRVGAMCSCAEEDEADPKCKICGGTGKILPKGKGGFLGHEWDLHIPEVEIWRSINKILKPGAYVLAFAGTRTQHRMACNIEDGGFEIRDMIAWMYSSGAPKGLDVSHAIDKVMGTPSEVTDVVENGDVEYNKDGSSRIEDKVTVAPTSEDARKWAGFHTSLKPSMEPLTVARKMIPGRVVDNILKHGTGAMNIKACKIEEENKVNVMSFLEGDVDEQEDNGRWPTNIIHDGSSEVLAIFPKDAKRKSIARFFYCSKPSTLDRDEGLYGFEKKESGAMDGFKKRGEKEKPKTRKRNLHSTVKPTDLMRYLCKLVTPPGGIVFDPFMGSGSTGKGAVLEGFGFIGIERDKGSFDIAVARIKHALMLAGRTNIELSEDMIKVSK